MFTVRLELHFKHCADKPSALTSESYIVGCTELAQRIKSEPSRSTFSAHCSLSPSELFKVPAENYVHCCTMLISVRLKRQHALLHKEGREMKIKYEVTKIYPLIAAKLTKSLGNRNEDSSSSRFAFCTK
jgi:hypothetical protein